MAVDIPTVREIGLSRRINKQILSWSLYDWANSAYTTTVMAGFFPIFFKQYWSAGSSTVESSFHLGVANSLASFVIVLLAPVLGAIADYASAKKKFLFFFTFLGLLMTGLLSLVAQGQWQYAVALYVLSGIGYSGGVIFYDALIVDVAEARIMDFVSALGYALGYLGGGLLFAVNVLMYLDPAQFGFADRAEAVRASFVMVAFWWGLFTLPLLFFVRERGKAGHGVIAAMRGGFRQLSATFHEIRKLRVVMLFLLGYWFYIDGVDTIIRMAVDYGMSLGYPAESLIVALLITQFVGFPAAVGFGYLGEKIGTKTGIYIAIFTYIIICISAYAMDSITEFYMLAIGIGLVQGGIQSLSRSFYTRIIPKDKAAEFFGFYNMLGKFAAVLGPLLMGGVALVSGDTRASILSVIILFVIGGSIFYLVDEQKGQRMARELEKL